MTYRINKFDGTVLTDVVDGTIDQISTDLTLVGSDVSGYGEILNENFIHLLENFASTKVPPNPIAGQIWYDLAESVLKVYNGTEFIKISGTLFESDSPTVYTNPGDLWIKSDKGQLYFNDGAGIKLAGPIYDKTQGMSGFQVVTVDSYTVVCLWISNVLVGILSNVEFTPTTPIFTYSGIVNAGITLLYPNISNTTANLTLNAINLYEGQQPTTNVTIYSHNNNFKVSAPSGNIDADGARVMNVGVPTELHDTVTVEYSKIYYATTQTVDSNIISELEILAPHAEYIAGVQAHVLCTAIPERRKYIISSTGWTGPIV